MFDELWNDVAAGAERLAEAHDALLPDEIVEVSGEPRERMEKRLTALARLLHGLADDLEALDAELYDD